MPGDQRRYYVEVRDGEDVAIGESSDALSEVVVDGMRFLSSSKRVTWTLLRLPTVQP